MEPDNRDRGEDDRNEREDIYVDDDEESLAYDDYGDIRKEEK